MWLDIGIVILLLVVGGLFTATELALVSLRAGQLRAIAGRGGRGARVARLAGEPTRYLAAVQIGSIVAGFFAAAFGAAALAEPLSGPLVSWGMDAEAAEALAVIAITLLITYIALVISELTPRRYAMQRAEGVAMALGPILDRLATVFRPLIWLLSKSTNGALRVLRADPSAFRDEIGVEELREMVLTHEGLPQQEQRIVREVFAASERTVREVMLPRAAIDFLDASMPVEAAAAAAWEHAHTRYPVIDGSPDRVIGFVHVRDLLDPSLAGRGVTVREVVRGITAFPGSTPLLTALSELQSANAHLAVVVDEYGALVGIVTVENLVEELVGDIYDEYDTVPPPADPSGPSEEFDGLTRIGDFRQRTGIDLPKGPYDTIGGLLVTVLGRVPAIGDDVEVAGHRLTVVAVDGWRVQRLAVNDIEQV
jgi:putative hemolysin